MKNKKLNSSMPSICELEDFNNLLKEAWGSGILTNNGPLLQKLENNICDSLGLNNYLAVTNGTTALQLAIEALDIKGTIIIPAFSWIATASAVSWQKCKIKFCDIDPKTLNICSDSIEKVIDPSVEAIMPVHVFGNPCEVEKIEIIAKKYKLKIIYDAAHAFGSTVDGKSVLNHGDISCVSTHATKIFNTAEGGGIVSNSKIINKKVKAIRYFIFDKNKNIIDNGTNAKMTEIHAALGLANLKNLKFTINHRKKINSIYRQELFKCKNLDFQEITVGSNCSYFPIILEDGTICLRLIKLLNQHNIFPRRYFYPSLNNIEFLPSSGKCPISESISERILCLPSHNKVNIDDVIFISNIICKYLK